MKEGTSLKDNRVVRQPTGLSNRSNSCLQTYFNQIRNIPLLTFDEELELSRHIRSGNKAARRRLIEANLRLVVRIARGYFSTGVSLMDLVQEGNMGLIRAVDKYDHARRVRFSTYAAWWIRQTIVRFLFEKRRIIRLPHKKEETLRKIKRASQTLSQVYMRPPKAEEIAAQIGVPQTDVDLLLGIAHDFVFLETKGQNHESMDVIDFHEDHTYSPERALVRKNSREATLKVLDQLKDREKRVLIYRYQLNGEERHTLKNISDKMGLSPETIRQIEIKALRKLRGHAEELRSYMEVV